MRDMGSFDFYDDEFHGRCNIVDAYIDQLQELLEDGLYEDAQILSSKINDMTWVSSSVG